MACRRSPVPPSDTLTSPHCLCEPSCLRWPFHFVPVPTYELVQLLNGGQAGGGGLAAVGGGTQGSTARPPLLPADACRLGRRKDAAEGRRTACGGAGAQQRRLGAH